MSAHSATGSFHHKNLRPSLSGSAVTAGLATAQRMRAQMARMGTDKNIRVIRAILLRRPIPQQETEQTEARVRLRALRCLLFKPPGARSPPNGPSSATAAGDALQAATVASKFSRTVRL